MRASVLCIGAALVAAGCSHSKNQETTEEVRQQQPPAAEAETQGGYTGSVGANATSGSGQDCPMQVTGTTLRTEDTSGGVALVFLTSGDVSELRTRVRRLADMHNQMQSGSRSNMQQGASSSTPSSSMPGTGNYDTQGSGAPGGGSMGEGSTYSGSTGMQQPSTQGGGGMMPSATARAEDIDGGAQLILIATDPSQTDTLRQNVRQEAQDMAAGNCSMMMQGSGSGGMQQNQMQQKQMQQNQQQMNPPTMPPNGMQNEGGY